MNLLRTFPFEWYRRRRREVFSHSATAPRDFVERMRIACGTDDIDVVLLVAEEAKDYRSDEFDMRLKPMMQWWLAGVDTWREGDSVVVEWRRRLTALGELKRIEVIEQPTSKAPLVRWVPIVGDEICRMDVQADAIVHARRCLTHGGFKQLADEHEAAMLRKRAQLREMGREVAEHSTQQAKLDVAACGSPTKEERIAAGARHEAHIGIREASDGRMAKALRQVAHTTGA